MFRSAKSSKISDHIVEQIRGAILEGVLNPGDKLPSEKALMEEFEVSKATLREALRSLETLGFLKIRKGASGGAFVTEVDTKKAGEFLVNFFHFKNVSLRDISEVRILVESYIAEKAAQMISEENVRKLKKLNDEFASQLKMKLPPEFYNQQIEFHRIIGNAIGNPVLIFTLDFISDILVGAKKILKPRKEFYEEVLNAHKRIYKALVEKNSKKARAAMIKHIREEEEMLFNLQKGRPGEPLELRTAFFNKLAG